MKSDYEQLMEVDSRKIAEAVKLQLPIIVTSYTLPRNMETYIREVLKTFLTECRQEQLFEYLNFCLSELMTNAKKANTKRVYFEERNLDINNLEDYEKGMKTFKEDTLTNIDHYLELQKKKGLYIKLLLQLRGDKIKIEIRNNSILTGREAGRIQSKLECVQKFENVQEAFQNELDQSEGAGFGIIIIVLMLQKVGLSKDNYQVFVDDKETVTRIILPCNWKIFGGIEMLSYQYVKLQNTYPCLQEHFSKAQKFVNSPELDRKAFYDYISKDLILSMLMLKKSLQKKDTNLNLLEVFNTFTDGELREIFSLDNPDLSVINTTEDTKKYFDHSRNVAYYAYNIAKNFALPGALSPESLYTLGLLNSIGLVMIKTATPEQTQYVDDLLKNYDVAQQIKDIFYRGITADYIGMVFAKKEGFPSIVSSVFGFWNNIESIDLDNLANHKVIYFAEMLQCYDEGRIEFYQLDKEILKEFNITAEVQFTHILDELKKKGLFFCR